LYTTLNSVFAVVVVVVVVVVVEPDWTTAAKPLILLAAGIPLLFTAAVSCAGVKLVAGDTTVHLNDFLPAGGGAVPAGAALCVIVVAAGESFAFIRFILAVLAPVEAVVVYVTMKLNVPPPDILRVIREPTAGFLCFRQVFGILM
jgi:hypothetical protein